MILPLDFVAIGSVITAITLLIIHYSLAVKYGTGFFTCGLISAAAIAIVAATIALMPAEPVAIAAADIGITLAGALAFTGAVWLLQAFRAAGDTDEP